jgi:hypothetical protein
MEYFRVAAEQDFMHVPATAVLVMAPAALVW